MGTVFTGIIVAGIAGLAVYSMVRDRKNGKSVCGGDCTHCKGLADRGFALYLLSSFSL